MLDDYELIERAPTPDEYRAICDAVGWTAVINFEAAVTSLERSLYAIVAVKDGQTVAMGRIIGDGAMYFYVQDIATLPEHQDEGIGQQSKAFSYMRPTNEPPHLRELLALQPLEVGLGKRRPKHDLGEQIEQRGLG